MTSKVSPGVRTEVKITFKGPLFDKRILKGIDKAANQTVHEIVSTGQDRLAMMARPRPGGFFKESTGNYRRHIHTRFGHLFGLIDDGGVVYGPWLEVGGGRFKGYHMFRRTTQIMEKIKEKVLQKHIGKMLSQS